LEALTVGCVINNTARIDLVEGEFKKVGEPTEAALKVFAEKVSGNPVDNASAFSYEKKMKQKIEVIATLDFTS
jgi:magnesium-transporting ATPase (P-type)